MREDATGTIPSFDDAEGWSCDYDADDRDSWQLPDLVLNRLGLHEDSTVADLGSATGYFTTRIARRVPQGRVYGVDRAPGMVDYLRRRADLESLDNIEVRLGKRDDPTLPAGVDAVLAANLLRFVDSPQAYVAALYRELDIGARVVLVDWKDPAAEQLAVHLMQEAGFTLDFQDEDALPVQFVLTFRK